MQVVIPDLDDKQVFAPPRRIQSPTASVSGSSNHASVRPSFEDNPPSSSRQLQNITTNLPSFQLGRPAIVSAFTLLYIHAISILSRHRSRQNTPMHLQVRFEVLHSPRMAGQEALPASHPPVDLAVLDSACPPPPPLLFKVTVSSSIRQHLVKPESCFRWSHRGKCFLFRLEFPHKASFVLTSLRSQIALTTSRRMLLFRLLGPTTPKWTAAPGYSRSGLGCGRPHSRYRFRTVHSSSATANVGNQLPIPTPSGSSFARFYSPPERSTPLSSRRDRSGQLHLVPFSSYSPQHLHVRISIFPLPTWSDAFLSFRLAVLCRRCQQLRRQRTYPHSSSITDLPPVPPLPGAADSVYADMPVTPGGHTNNAAFQLPRAMASTTSFEHSDLGGSPLRLSTRQLLDDPAQVRPFAGSRRER